MTKRLLSKVRSKEVMLGLGNLEVVDIDPEEGTVLVPEDILVVESVEEVAAIKMSSGAHVSFFKSRNWKIWASKTPASGQYCRFPPMPTVGP